MPTLFTIEGFRFFFYSNDHLPVHVHVQYGRFVSVAFVDGVLFRFPVSGNRRLAGGTPEQLSNMQVSRFGIHWPDLDEDLSFEGLSRGDYGQSANPPSERNVEAGVPPLSVAESAPPPYS